MSSTGLISKNRAFSFLEIILVVVVLAVIAGLSLPNFRHTFQRIQLQKTAEDLSYIMRYAQSRAVTKGLVVRLQFDADYKQYWLTQQKQEEEGFERFSSRLARRFDIPDGISVKSVSYLQFYPDGNMDKERILVCRDEDCYTISTKEQRGHVRVYSKSISDVQ